MKTKTRNYRFLVKLLAKEHVFSKKYCKTIASNFISSSEFCDLPMQVCNHQQSAAFVLAHMIIWHGSPEGYNYWYRIHCKLNKGINVNGEYIGTSDKEIDEALLIPL